MYCKKPVGGGGSNFTRWVGIAGDRCIRPYSCSCSEICQRTNGKWEHGQRHTPLRRPTYISPNPANFRQAPQNLWERPVCLIWRLEGFSARSSSKFFVERSDRSIVLRCQEYYQLQSIPQLPLCDISDENKPVCSFSERSCWTSSINLLLPGPRSARTARVVVNEGERAYKLPYSGQ